MMLRIILPPGPMTSRILSTGIRMVTMRGANAEIDCPRRGERLVHLAEDVQPAAARLLERLPHHLGGDAGDLDVHLQRGDAVGGAGDLEVHVAVVILGAGDVAEDGVLARLLVHHQAHRDAGDRRLAAARRRPSSRASRRRPTPSTTSRSTRGCPRRRGSCTGTVSSPGMHRRQRALGERAVTDLAAARARAGTPLRRPRTAGSCSGA